jgi:hypothetical protein
VIDAVVAPVLHNKDPVNNSAVNVELPQLFTTDTVGAVTLELNRSRNSLAVGARAPIHSLRNCIGSGGRHCD